MGLEIDYRVATVAELVEAGERFDVVLALEIIEHVNDPPAFVADVIAARAEGGQVLFSTFNRTLRSFALGIVAAEYVLRWLPTGTHDWRRFVPPAEMFEMVEAEGLHPQRIKGFMFNPLLDKWLLADIPVCPYRQLPLGAGPAADAWSFRPPRGTSRAWA